MMMSETHEIEKWIWTEADFDVMGWHDSRVHALAFLPDEFEIVFDIDYILKWVHPQPEETTFKFWVSPATLVFENVYDVDFNIGSIGVELDILNVTREDTGPPRNAEYIGKDVEWLWIIECAQGEIKFRSAGYKQYLRSSPVFGSQVLESKSRGVSFFRGKTDESSL